MRIDLTVKNSDKVQRALAKLSGDQATAAYRLAVRDTAFKARKAVQDEMRRVFDRPTRYITNSVRVHLDPDDLRATIEPTQYGSPGVDPQKILQAQEYGGRRSAKRAERVLQQVGILPSGWVTVPGQGARLDAYGNMSRGQVMQILSQLRAQTTAGYTRNMRHGKAGIA
ncbi:MAG: hypothetical protein ACK5LJ_14660, partial [Paracoccus sp. (in: a-proteobacteria)]